MKNTFLQLTSIALLTLAGLRADAQSWKLIGNAGTNPNTNFLGTTDNQRLVIRTNNLERIRITKAGNVGIGTSAPAGKLNVNGGSNLSLSIPGYAVIGNISGFNLGADNEQIQARSNGNASSLYLNAWGGTTFVGSGSNSYSGLVAYGTSYGLSGYSYNSGSTGINGGGPSDGFGVAGSGYYGTFGYSSTGGYGVYGQGASGSYGVEGYSNLSIGVYGATGNSSSYAGFFVGNVYTTGSYLGSDEKLKQNISDFSSAMDIINKLHPKQYQYRQDGNYKLMNLPQGSHYGLIAQDVEKILPNLVKDSKFDVMKPVQYKVTADPQNPNAKSTTSIMTKTEDAIDFKALNYTELIPIMIKGMQEQQAVIQQQQKQMEQQQQQINDLKQMLQTFTVSNTNLLGSQGNAWLQQNTPNPFNQNTIIHCYVPSSVKQAQLIVYSLDGRQLKSFILNNGTNEVNIAAGELPSGQYTYSLLIDGKSINSKNMILTK